MFRSSKDIWFSSKEKVNSNQFGKYRCDLCGQGPWSTELDVEIHRKNEHQFELLTDLKNHNISMCSVSYKLHFIYV